MPGEVDLISKSVTIVGGAGFLRQDLRDCLDNAPILVAADGAANAFEEDRYKPNYIVGDLDSLTNKKYWDASRTTIFKIDEQETTDFEKCLYTINANTYFCTGFIGRRADHFLSVCSTLVKYYYKKVILVGSHDVIFHIPKTIEMTLPLGTRVSLFPMRNLLGINDRGLRWPISGLEFDPLKRVGTSNETVSKKVKLTFSDNGMLILLPRSSLAHVVKLFFTPIVTN